MRPRQSSPSARAWSPLQKPLIKPSTSHRISLCRIRLCSIQGRAIRAKCRSITRVLSIQSSSTRYLLGAIHQISPCQGQLIIYQTLCSKTKTKPFRGCIWIANLALRCQQEEPKIMKTQTCRQNKEKSSRNSKSAHSNPKLTQGYPDQSQTTVKVVVDSLWVNRSRRALSISHNLIHVRLMAKLEAVKRELAKWVTGWTMKES